jgi:hypothetical protein
MNMIMPPANLFGAPANNYALGAGSLYGNPYARPPIAKIAAKKNSKINARFG